MSLSESLELVYLGTTMFKAASNEAICMHRGMIFSTFLFMITPLFATAEPTIKLWPEGTISGLCANHSHAYRVEPTNQVVFGHKWPHVKGGGIEFIDHSVALLNAAASV